MGNIKFLLIVGAGSCIGGMFRYLLSVLITTKSSTFPLATLIVNIVGSFTIGIVYALADNGAVDEHWRLFLATGVLGGFTTYSAFSHETFTMLRDGNLLYAVVYVGITLVAGLAATYLGWQLVR